MSVVVPFYVLNCETINSAEMLKHTNIFLMISVLFSWIETYSQTKQISRGAMQGAKTHAGSYSLPHSMGLKSMVP